jgi:IS4 transposase
MTKHEILGSLDQLRMIELAEIIKKAQTLRRAGKFRKDMILRQKRDSFWEEIRRNLGIQFATSSASHNRWSFSWKNERFGITLGEESFNISLYGTNSKKRVKRNKLGSVNLPSVLQTMISLSQTNRVLND